MKNIIFPLLVVISFQLNAQVDSGIKINKKSSDEILELIDKGMSFLSERDYSRTDSIINLVSPHIDSLSSSLVLFDFNKLKADIYFDRHQMNEAIKAYEVCLQESRKLNDTAKLILAYSGLGNANVFNRRSKEALLYFEEIISILEDAKPVKYYQVKSNAAMAYNQIGQVDKSLEYYLEVKDYFNKNEDDEGLAVIENNIGELYRESLQNFEMAKKHYRWAIEINLKTGNNFRLSQVYHNMSLLFGHEKVYDSAFYYLEKSKTLKENMGDLGGLAISYNALGSFYSETGNYVKAIESFDETIRISEEFGIAPGLYFGNLGKATTYNLIGSKREALIFYLRAKEVADNLQDLEMRRGINENIFEFYKANQNYKEALEVYEELNSVKDSLSAIERSESLAEVRTRYETGIAEQENERLREKELSQQKLIAQQRNFLLMLIGALLVFVVMIVILWD
jgi:tetratricopeptide (TPR) repeat protein